MRQIRFLFFIVILISLTTRISIAQTTTMHVLVKNISKGQGAMFVAVYNNEKDYMKNRFAEAIQEVNSVDDLLVKIDILPGTYAISIFHDIDGDDELNKNFFGIPTEPFGFSNNPRMTFGPPNFKEASFRFEEDGQVVEIKLTD